MLAVIEVGGKQYNVTLGTKFKTEKIDLAEGKTFGVEKVLLVSEDDGADFKMGMPLLKEEKVEAKVISHGKAEKIRVFKMKSKKRYSKTQGHRQQYTELEIVAIGGKKAPAKAETKSAVKPKTEATAKSTSAKTTAEKNVTKVKEDDKMKTAEKKETVKKSPTKEEATTKKTTATKKTAEKK